MRDRNPQFKGAPLNQPWPKQRQARRVVPTLLRFAFAAAVLGVLWFSQSSCEARATNPTVCVD